MTNKDLEDDDEWSQLDLFAQLLSHQNKHENKHGNKFFWFLLIFKVLIFLNKK
jgi:hypothetical protein